MEQDYFEKKHVIDEVKSIKDLKPFIIRTLTFLCFDELANHPASSHDHYLTHFSDYRSIALCYIKDNESHDTVYVTDEFKDEFLEKAEQHKEFNNFAIQYSYDCIIIVDGDNYTIIKNRFGRSASFNINTDASEISFNIIDSRNNSKEFYKEDKTFTYEPHYVITKYNTMKEREEYLAFVTSAFFPYDKDGTKWVTDINEAWKFSNKHEALEHMKSYPRKCKEAYLYCIQEKQISYNEIKGYKVSNYE